MTWIELHDSAPDHPKTLKLARRLNIDDVQALGHMAALWAWTLRMAADGDLSAFDHESIELGAKWRGEPGAFVRTALEVGFLDEGPRVHDWEYFCGSLKTRLRVREHRKRKANAPETLPPATVALGTWTDRPTDRTTDASSVAPLPEPSGVRFEVKGGHWTPSHAFIEELRGHFPALPVDLTLADARAWVEANPSRRKTAKGMERFLLGWFKRAAQRPANDPRRPRESREIVNYYEVGRE